MSDPAPVTEAQLVSAAIALQQIAATVDSFGFAVELIDIADWLAGHRARAGSRWPQRASLEPEHCCDQVDD